MQVDPGVHVAAFGLQIVGGQQQMRPSDQTGLWHHVPKIWGASRVCPALPHEHQLGVGEFAASEFDEATSAASEGVNATATMAMAILTSCIFCLLSFVVRGLPLESHLKRCFEEIKEERQEMPTSLLGVLVKKKERSRADDIEGGV